MDQVYLPCWLTKELEHMVLFGAFSLGLPVLPIFKSKQQGLFPSFRIDAHIGLQVILVCRGQGRKRRMSGVMGHGYGSVAHVRMASPSSSSSSRRPPPGLLSLEGGGCPEVSSSGLMSYSLQGEPWQASFWGCVEEGFFICFLLSREKGEG